MNRTENKFIFYWNERGYEGNAVTASIIQTCRTESTVDQLVARICNEFQVDPEEARADIEEILQQLREIGILFSQFQGGIQ
mgnify:CR=1 FL=1